MFFLLRKMFFYCTNWTKNIFFFLFLLHELNHFLGIYNEDDVVQAYALATVKAIHITSDGCSYTLTLDKGNEERDGVEEEWLFRSVEAV